MLCTCSLKAAPAAPSPAARGGCHSAAGLGE